MKKEEVGKSMPTVVEKTKKVRSKSTVNFYREFLPHFSS